MSYLEQLEEVIERQRKETQSLSIEQISQMLLEEFAKRNMAVEIYSEILGRNIWLCSNEEMSLKVQEDNSKVRCYDFTATYFILLNIGNDL